MSKIHAIFNIVNDNNDIVVAENNLLKLYQNA